MFPGTPCTVRRVSEAAGSRKTSVEPRFRSRTCATARPSSPFLMLKEVSTITDADARSLSIADGRLLISKQFANALGRPSDAGSMIGKISVGAAMQPIEITQVVNGKPKSVVAPPLSQRAGPGAPTLVRRTRYHRWGPAGLGTIRHRGITGRPGGGDDFLQQRRPTGQFFRNCQTQIIRSFRKIFIG